MKWTPEEFAELQAMEERIKEMAATREMPVLFYYCGETTEESLKDCQVVIYGKDEDTLHMAWETLQLIQANL